MAVGRNAATNGGTPRALVYCRVSSAGQEDNSSLETQEAGCRAYAAERGWAVVGVHREVHTGADLFERPGLSALRAAVREGHTDVVLAHALDRLTRNQAHLGLILSECDHHGVSVNFVTEQLEDTPEGRLLQSVRGFVAEIERLKIAERSRRGVRARVDKGSPIPGPKAPYGYRWRDERKSGYELDPATAPIARRIYDAILGGHTLRSVAMTLTAEGIPTPTGRGNRWEPATLHCLLTHPVYTGRAFAYRTKVERLKGGTTRSMLRPEAEHVALPEGTAPRLVSDAEFEAVQARFAANRASATRNNANPEATLLRCGFAICGYCEHALSITKRKGRPHLYRCHPVGRDRHGCPSFGVTAPILDLAVWQRVEQVLTQPEIIAAEVARRKECDPCPGDVAAVDRRLTTIAEQRSRLARAVANVDDDEASAPLISELCVLAEQAKGLQKERAALLAQASASAANRERLADLATWCARVAGNLPNLTYGERRMILEALGVRVKVYRADHTPRWEITMAPAPVPSPSPENADAIVFSKGSRFSRATARWTRKASTGSRRRSRRGRW